MCLIFFAYDCHPRYRLILAANRDEYYNRPTEPAHFWASHPRVLAGRDLEMMGTWMGITRSGRFAALTNFRDPSAQILNAKSRGMLVGNFLCSNESPDQYMIDVANNRALYNPFNLLVGDLSRFLYFSKQASEVEVIEPGIYGLSNHYLNTPWPKLRKSKQVLANYLEDKMIIEPQALFEILGDRKLAQDSELPNTGIAQERERMLSSIFIQGSEYGTRSSTVLLIDKNNHVIFQEKSFILGQDICGEMNYEFDISH
ncbi:NRDE family protein [Desulfosporosinus sp. Sb-LF]|uniref:NRDE family protein n=1 Tax=Desulfosporosinus sp. Sb-LF TaxID=2560027 RepID=UPI00107F6352|nr:NRDE family protein [Desulfosporosinus sp. Sb-LF]TGE33613.1 NRDE family protein [Desulfosporosinus sp. Sb-LF]